MTPSEFVLFDGDSSPDTPISEVYEALRSPLIIASADGPYSVLSYYCSNGRMVLEIEKDHVV